MLIVTNGDSAVATLDHAGIPGEKLAWKDVLHDGPLPEGLALDGLSTVRARFIADCGWGDYDHVLAEFHDRDARLNASFIEDEVVLWFEHDLCDQLQLIQLLDWFLRLEHRPGRLALICHDRFVGNLSPEQAREDFATRRVVSDRQLELGAAAWRAVRSPSPEAVVDLLLEDLTALPFLRGALERFLEELPGRDGLARSERQALRAIAGGATDRGAAFLANRELETAPAYLGDASFFAYLARLARGTAPLVRESNEGLALTDLGRAVLEGREDRVRVCGLERWLGGVRLCPENVWRWDTERRMLRQTWRDR